jgi:hypothetical protein
VKRGDYMICPDKLASMAPQRFRLIGYSSQETWILTRNFHS